MIANEPGRAELLLTQAQPHDREQFTDEEDYDDEEDDEDDDREIDLEEEEKRASKKTKHN
jgi:hypothetical protein